MLLNNRCILLIISKRLFVSLAKLYEATVIFGSHYKNLKPSAELNSDMTLKYFLIPEL